MSEIKNLGPGLLGIKLGGVAESRGIDSTKLLNVCYILGFNESFNVLPSIVLQTLRVVAYWGWLLEHRQ
jgi:hypothetical protein